VNGSSAEQAWKDDRSPVTLGEVSVVERLWLVCGLSASANGEVKPHWLASDGSLNILSGMEKLDTGTTRKAQARTGRLMLGRCSFLGVLLRVQRELGNVRRPKIIFISWGAVRSWGSC
jgi:hypothetical protein